LRSRRARLLPALIRARRCFLLAASAAVLAACSTTGHDSTERVEGPPPTVYTVKRGDTLYSIAWRHDLKYRKVAAWNDIGPPYTIYPGQKIRLRAPVKGQSGQAGGDADGADDGSGAAESSHGSRRAASGYDWEWPASGEVVSDYGAKEYGKKGISVGGEYRGPVRAAAGGRVVYSGSGLRGYGNLVIVKHDETYLTAYGYNHELLVGEGDDIARGERIARMGRSPDGVAAVHFELRRDGQPVNPLRYLPER
jgi:lipoprotein NlpD